MKFTGTVVKYAVEAGLITAFYFLVDQPSATKGVLYMFVELAVVLFIADKAASAIVK